MREACLMAVTMAAVAAGASGQQVVSFPDFSDTTGLTLSGSAQVLTTSDGEVIRLASEGQTSGSVFSSAPISSAVFQADFSFRITDPGGVSDGVDGPGADGIAFVVQTLASDIGGSGGGLGYQGIAPSVAVEFDTFFNGVFNDPSSNHVGIDVNGSVDSVVTADVAPNFDNGEIWNARVIYNGAVLTVFAALEGESFGEALLSLAIDIPATVGQAEAFVGFTAGTAAAFGNHDLLSFTYDSTIPAPAGGFVVAGLGIGLARRRR